MGFLKKIFGREKNIIRRPRCAAVVAAAGASVRMGGEDKQFVELCGMPVVARTLMALQNCELIDEIVVAVRSETMEDMAAICKDYGITKATKVIIGGETRVQSVYNAVMETSKNVAYIAVHDGARPLVTNDVIEKAIKKAQETNAAAPCVPVKDTVKIVENGKVSSTPERKTLFAFQTPQVFSADVLKAALQNALVKKLDISDDCMAVEMMGMHVYASPGSEENIKITTPMDLTIAEAILNRREEQGL